MGVFPRERLFADLDQKCRYPAVWVNGPPGSGKTTLTASYLLTRKLPALWYQIDEGDSGLATFFYYLGLAAQKTTPRKKKSLPLLTPEYAFGIPTFSRRFNVFILSRTGPTPTVARARANNHLDLLGWPELRLKNEETREMVRFLSRKDYSDA